MACLHQRVELSLIDVTVIRRNPEAKAKPTTAIGREQFLPSAATAFVSENSKFPDSVAAALLLMRAGFLAWGNDAYLWHNTWNNSSKFGKRNCS
jgi:hypothetical protein